MSWNLKKKEWKKTPSKNHETKNKLFLTFRYGYQQEGWVRKSIMDLHVKLLWGAAVKRTNSLYPSAWRRNIKNSQK